MEKQTLAVIPSTCTSAFMLSVNPARREINSEHTQWIKGIQADVNVHNIVTALYIFKNVWIDVL